MTENNVYQRLSKVCELIGNQPWVKSMENQKFKSIPIDDMRRGVRDACVKSGLIHIGPYDIESRRSHKGDNMDLIEGSCKFRYVNIEKPEESIEYESMGEAMDTGDKCTGKFITNLIKNHYKSAFDIGELGKDDIDAYSNEEMYAEAESIKLRSKPKSPIQDPFFRPEHKKVKIPEAKKEEVPDFVTGDQMERSLIPSESEMANIINVRGSSEKYKEVVKAFKQEHHAKTPYDLSYDAKVELYNIILAMEEFP
ncbi:MAG: ERF family protein [Clostridia bacterium]